MGVSRGLKSVLEVFNRFHGRSRSFQGSTRGIHGVALNFRGVPGVLIEFQGRSEDPCSRGFQGFSWGVPSGFRSITEGFEGVIGDFKVFQGR